MSDVSLLTPTNPVAPLRLDDWVQRLTKTGSGRRLPPPHPLGPRTLPEPVFPRHPERLGGDDEPLVQERHWTAPQIYGKLNGWLFPYIKSRVLPGEFHPILAYLFTDWRCNLDCHYCSAPVPAQASATPSSAAAPPISLPPPVGPRPPANGAAAGPNPAQTQRLTFHGVGGSLFGIHIVNVFLTIITLGIYYFWAKVRIRSYLFSQTEFAGARFAYHGTGKELLFGFLKAVALIGLPFFLLRLGLDFVARGPIAQAVGAAISYLPILVFLAFATVGARRYRLSRTSWRGVRFSFRGHLLEFIKLCVGGWLLSTVTLGLYYPFFDTRRHGFLVSHSYFGSQRFSFDGTGKDLFGRFLLAILLSLPTLGLCWFWYLARKQRYFWDHTSFGAARFRSTVTGGTLLALHPAGRPALGSPLCAVPGARGEGDPPAVYVSGGRRRRPRGRARGSRSRPWPWRRCRSPSA